MKEQKEVCILTVRELSVALLAAFVAGAALATAVAMELAK